MTYDIVIGARTAGNDRLGTVYLRHAPHDADKIIRLRERMMVNGWEGRPVVLFDNTEHHIAFCGTHRLAAAQGIDDLIQAVILSSCTAEQWDAIDMCNDDDELARALADIAEERRDAGEDDAEDWQAAADALAAEVQANNA